MNTFTRLSTISVSDIQAVRDKVIGSRKNAYKNGNSVWSEHRQGKHHEPVPLSYSLISETHSASSDDEEDQLFCPLFNNHVVVMAPIFGFFGKVDTKVWYSLILLMLLLVHITIGATVFKHLETGSSKDNITQELIKKRMFLEYFMMEVGVPRPDNQTNDKITREDLDKMRELYAARCYKSDNAATDANMWNFWTSLDFASTIITTIGYGGMAPRTETGKLFVIVYTIPGMLLMMSYLNIFSTCILIILRKIIKLIRRIVNQTRMPDIVEQGIVLGISLVFLSSYLVIMALMMHLSNRKNDSMLKSLYFYVITMTTVGFGDITLIDYTWIALIRVLFAFCIGLVMVSLVFNAIRELAAAYQRRVVEVSTKLAMKTLQVAKQHRLKSGGNNLAISNGGGEHLVVDD